MERSMVKYNDIDTKCKSFCKKKKKPTYKISFVYLLQYLYFFLFTRVNNKYAKGTAQKILINVEAITPIPTVKANVANTPEPNTIIAIKTSNVDNDVPMDLFIVCQILSSNIDII